MSSKGCRDCAVCTRSIAEKFAMLLPRALYGVVFSWNYGAFKGNAPTAATF